VGLVADRRGHLAQPLAGGAHRRIFGQMRLELEALHRVELAVDVGVQQFVGFFACHLCTCVPENLEVAPSDSARSRRARARRDITVPIGTSVMRAMSLYDRSSSSRRISASRNWRGSAAIASLSIFRSKLRAARTSGPSSSVGMSSIKPSSNPTLSAGRLTCSQVRKVLRT